MSCHAEPRPDSHGVKSVRGRIACSLLLQRKRRASTITTVTNCASSCAESCLLRVVGIEGPFKLLVFQRNGNPSSKTLVKMQMNLACRSSRAGSLSVPISQPVSLVGSSYTTPLWPNICLQNVPETSRIGEACYLKSHALPSWIQDALCLTP